MGKTPFSRQPMSLDEAIMYGFLVHRYSHAVKNKKLRSDGYFEVSFSERFLHAPLDLELQDEVLVTLQKRGYVKIKCSKNSHKRHYKIFVDKLLRDIRFD